MKSITHKSSGALFPLWPLPKKYEWVFFPVSIIVFIDGIYNSNHSNNNDGNNNTTMVMEIIIFLVKMIITVMFGTIVMIASIISNCIYRFPWKATWKIHGKY